jgi:hypothetical protein
LIVGFAGVVFVVLVVAFMAQNLGLQLTLTKTTASPTSDPMNPGASSVAFSSWELQAWVGIKDRLVVYNSDPEFKGNRTLEWISMRNSSSTDYYQKSMEYLCFWSGRSADGEWEAVVSIYNVPNSKSDFVVEASRFTWHQLHVLLDGKVMADFPQVTNDTTSLGYVTFHVTQFRQPLES